MKRTILVAILSMLLSVSYSQLDIGPTVEYNHELLFNPYAVADFISEEQTRLESVTTTPFGIQFEPKHKSVIRILYSQRKITEEKHITDDKSDGWSYINSRYEYHQLTFDIYRRIFFNKKKSWGLNAGAAAKINFSSKMEGTRTQYLFQEGGDDIVLDVSGFSENAKDSIPMAEFYINVGMGYKIKLTDNLYLPLDANVKFGFPYTTYYLKANELKSPYVVMFTLSTSFLYRIARKKE